MFFFTCVGRGARETGLDSLPPGDEDNQGGVGGGGQDIPGQLAPPAPRGAR